MIIGSDTRFQKAGNIDQCAVADCVSEGIIDSLEMIKVKPDDAEGILLAA